MSDILNRIFKNSIPEPMSGCWLWEKHVCKLGYGRIRIGGRAGKMRQAHVVSYELLVGAIPLGCELDHTCKLRCCVNPDHLEPVTHKENVLRGNAPSAINSRKTHCVHGHGHGHATYALLTTGVENENL